MVECVGWSGGQTIEERLSNSNRQLSLRQLSAILFESGLNGFVPPVLSQWSPDTEHIGHFRHAQSLQLYAHLLSNMHERR